MKFEQLGNITCIHGDCMDYMATIEDGAYDLAIVDPPYGIGMDGTVGIGIGKNKGFTKKKHYERKNWDKAMPSQKYFDELFRISKHQIVWGANYFTKQLPIIKNYIFWHKKGQSVDDKFNDGEMAYVSLGRTRMIDIWWNGVGVINSGETKIHPTQKPVKLYKWLLQNYAKQGNKILDTHGGSFSHAIACHDLGFELTIIEKDEDYFNQATERLKLHQRQLTLF